jgi:hypothetical protein
VTGLRVMELRVTELRVTELRGASSCRSSLSPWGSTAPQPLGSCIGMYVPVDGQ